MKSESGEFTHAKPWPNDPARFRAQATGCGQSLCMSAGSGEERKARVVASAGSRSRIPMAPGAEGFAPMSAAEMNKAMRTRADCDVCEDTSGGMGGDYE